MPDHGHTPSLQFSQAVYTPHPASSHRPPTARSAQTAEPTGHNKPVPPTGATPKTTPRSEGDKAEKLLTLAPLEQNALGRLADVQREAVLDTTLRRERLDV